MRFYIALFIGFYLGFLCCAIFAATRIAIMEHRLAKYSYNKVQCGEWDEDDEEAPAFISELEWERARRERAQVRLDAEARRP